MSKFNKHKIINTQSQKITKNNINQMKYKQNSKLNLKPTIKDINYKYKIDLEQLVWYINLKSSDSKWTKNVIEKRQSKFIYIIIPLEEDASWRIQKSIKNQTQEEFIISEENANHKLKPKKND